MITDIVSHNPKQTQIHRTRAIRYNVPVITTFPLGLYLIRRPTSNIPVLIHMASQAGIQQLKKCVLNLATSTSKVVRKR
eukprot:SAG11_NODE_4511_length_1868_cov_4.577728_1_plen_79_part_00